jgi:integrase
MGTTALKWAFTEAIIPADVTTGLTRFTGGETKRDILTEAETEAIFAVKWNDKRAYSGALLAATAGLWSGEIRAIRRCNIGEFILNVDHSWSDFDGLKTPKNGEARRVPLLPEVRRLLMELLAETPHTDIDNPYVFYSAEPDRPCSAELFRRGFRQACKAVSDNPPGWNREPETAEGTGTLWITQVERGKPWNKPEPANIVTVREERYEYCYKRSEELPETPVFIDLERRKLDIHSFRHYYCVFRLT